MSHLTFEVTDANFQDEVLKSETPVLVDFWAEWCGPCRMVAPIVEEMAKKYEGKLRVGKLDVDANGGVAEQFNVQGIPTLILFKGGEAVQQVVGYRGPAQLEAAVTPFLETEKTTDGTTA